MAARTIRAALTELLRSRPGKPLRIERQGFRAPTETELTMRADRFRPAKARAGEANERSAGAD